MSEIVGYDSWDGQLTRVYVWYPTCEAGRDWVNDPAIQHVLKEIWERPVEPKFYYPALTGWICLMGSPYYWHKYASGCVYVITRVYFKDGPNGEGPVSIPDSRYRARITV